MTVRTVTNLPAVTHRRDWRMIGHLARIRIRRGVLKIPVSLHFPQAKLIDRLGARLSFILGIYGDLGRQTAEPIADVPAALAAI